MENVKRIIKALGGTVEVAQSPEINAPNSTVSSWVSSNSIPRWRLSGILLLAVRKGVDINNLPEDVSSSGHADNNTDAAPAGLAGKSSDFTGAPEWPVEKVGAA